MASMASDGASSNDVNTLGNRVCDRCMIKKTKCSLQRPTCSRCAENKWQCAYSASKRKPGPPKGVTSKRQRTQNEAGSPGSPPVYPSPSADNSLSSYRIIQLPLDEASPRMAEDVFVTAETELDLVDLFFQYIQPFYPLFQRSDLIQRYQNGEVPRELKLAIFSVSACFSARTEITARTSAIYGEACASQVRRHFTSERLLGYDTSLDDLKTLFLLALYEFRNSPSRKAWANIGHLTRLAYSYGLHQVDNPANCVFYVAGVSTAFEMEQWRYLWWCIYILDCCCNVTVATPSNIEIDSLRTALPATSVYEFTNDEFKVHSKKLFYEDDIEVSSNLMKEICSSWLSGDHRSVNFNVRIISTAELREACNLARLMNENPRRQVHDRLVLLRNKVAASRLAMPTRYLDPARNTSAGETGLEHVRRLVNLLELRLTTLLVSLPRRTANLDQDDQWQLDWNSSIATIEEVTSTIREWDPRRVINADTAVCFIIFIAVVLLHADSRLGMNQPLKPGHEEASKSSRYLLRLFLERFASHWQLPKFLLAAFDGFQKVATGPMTRADVSHILFQIGSLLKCQQQPPRRRFSANIETVQHPLQAIDLEDIAMSDWLATFSPHDFESMWSIN